MNMTPAELRKIYKVARSTWSEWIRPLVKKKLVRANAKKYTPSEIKAIQDHLG
jgi:predicted HTH transcriptional regulator